MTYFIINHVNQSLQNIKKVIGKRFTETSNSEGKLTISHDLGVVPSSVVVNLNSELYSTVPYIDSLSKNDITVLLIRHDQNTKVVVPNYLTTGYIMICE